MDMATTGTPMRRRKDREKGDGAAKEAITALGSSADVPRARIELRAYELFLQRGCSDGHDLEDWLAAERELTASKPASESKRPLNGSA